MAQECRKAAGRGRVRHWHCHCGQLPVSAAGLGAGGCQFPPVTAGPGTAARPRRLKVQQGGKKASAVLVATLDKEGAQATSLC